jgi:CxxC-x17-CxxC domain-containing protein
MEYQDREITCLDCGQPFVFTAGEQEFYARKGFKEEPKRCKSCRDQRKVRRTDGAEAGAAGSSEDDVAVRGPREVRDMRDTVRMRPPRELFDAVCASCNQPTKVPFRPTAGRPVYCKDCFAAKR